MNKRKFFASLLGLAGVSLAPKVTTITGNENSFLSIKNRMMLERLYAGEKNNLKNGSVFYKLDAAWNT